MKLSTGFDTQGNTELIQDTFLALKRVVALVWLVDHPTSIRMEKPDLHFGLLVLHGVTGQEMKRVSVHVGRMRATGPQARSPPACVH